MEDKILFNQMLFTRKQTIKLIKEIPDDFIDIIPESHNHSIVGILDIYLQNKKYGCMSE
ncbi:hypothetical protein [Priestia megaterium]|uniref:hypothetical protein n=1 Tax=Priestia megaterium TaxID=1404 RepID=UPI0025A48CD4|nr:hypothetical protein [Priestia megaterium]MDM8150109.1 hypothetical protein [Priestia megaterium]